MNIVCVINDSHTVRERDSEGTEVLECGCAHTGTLWLQMCCPHMTEVNEFHELARAAHENARLIKELTS